MQLALDLINSEAWYGRGPAGAVDHLARTGGLERFLEARELAPARAPTERERKQLLALRTLMRRMVTALAAGDEPDAADLGELERLLAGAPLLRRVVQAEGGRRVVELAPVRRDWPWVLSEVAASFAELLEAERARIKLCENPECRWAFYDASKNRRRRWCDASECGNVFKVRAFRARKRAEAESA